MLQMMWLGGLIRRRPGRLAGTALGVALAVAFLGALGTFFAVSKAHMTEMAVGGVPVDWQVQLSRASNLSEAGRIIRSAPGVTRILPVGYADTTGFRAAATGTIQTTGPGEVLGLPSGYASTFPGEVRFLVGARRGALLAQQTAANLHATVGTLVSVGRPGLRPAPVRVDGIVDLPAADSLFQAIGLPSGAAPQAPPDNVLLLPASTWHRLFDPLRRIRPDAVRFQYHVKLSPALPPDPASAFQEVLARARNLEARLAGAAVIADNLGARLDAARQDSLYAQLLFLFLGIPGAILAALITWVIGASGSERRRREQALLRLRGASSGRILGLAAAEAALVGTLGAVAGVGGSVLIGRFALGSSRFGATPTQAAVWVSTAALSGLTLALLTMMVPAWRDARSLTVREARVEVGRTDRRLWARLYLDVACLAAAGLLFWQSVKSGYQVVLAPEGVPTISVSYFTFLAPLMLWLGSALFAWRLATHILTRSRSILAQLLRPVAGGLSGIVAAAMSRQRSVLSKGLMLMALTGSFAVSTALFNSTYAAQSRIDAELTNGADVVATTTASSGLPQALPRLASRLPGVLAVATMQHRFAYVGNDLQDLYGIVPGRIAQATSLSDAFFGGGHARKVLSELASRPDALLVSDETVRDFQLQPGDLIRIRLQFARDHAYHVVPFHYIGIVREFPTAPTDSFLVANASYVARATGSGAFQTLLVRTGTSPPLVAQEMRSILGRSSGAVVQDVVSQLHITRSGLTAVDLTGLTRLELAFAIVLSVAASGLVLALGLAERKRTFAIASALGARARQLASFVWSESAFVTVGGLLLGTLIGWALAFVLVKVLTGIFDPPPHHLFVPWRYLTVVGTVTLGATMLTAMGATRATSRPSIETIRDL